MSMNYRRAIEGEITCYQCHFARRRRNSNRIECLALWSPWCVGRKYTCNFAKQRGDK